MRMRFLLAVVTRQEEKEDMVSARATSKAFIGIVRVESWNMKDDWDDD
jgi:hypothetical protein